MSFLFVEDSDIIKLVITMKIFNGFTLKIIGIVSMTVDHIGFMLFPDQLWMRIIGRAAFPIFAFLIAEGFRHSSNVYKYLLRLSIFAVVLEFLFFLVKVFADSSAFIEGIPLNIFITLALGLATLIILEKEKKYYFLLPLILVIIFLLPVDYGFYGLITILMMYYLKGYILAIGFISLNIGYYLLERFGPEVVGELQYGLDFRSFQIFSIYTIIFILLYNGKQGRKLKYLFYFFYPFHLIFIYLIGEYILSN